MKKNIVERERLLKQLSGYNPWWAGKPLRTPEFRRTAFYQVMKSMRDPSLRRAVMLSGPRRVGKSVVLSQVAEQLIADGINPKAILYASLDDNVLKLSTISELIALYDEEVRLTPGTVYLLLDEVHYSKGWDQEIKTLVDHRPELRILATGSASLDAIKGDTPHAGVGRWVRVPIPTLSFFEFTQIRGESRVKGDALPRVLELRKASAKVLREVRATLPGLAPSFRRYLVVGGFPETSTRDDTAMCQKLLREDVVDRVLKRDIVSLFGVRNVDDLERLFLYLCLHSGGQLNVEECARQLSVPRPTISSYLSVLEHAHLLFRLSQDALSGKKLLKQRYKYYLTDAALRNAVLLAGEEVVDDAGQAGTIVETAVIRHMLAGFFLDVPRFSYWRDAVTQLEVDIIYRDRQSVVPIEVKYRDGASVTDAKGLIRFVEQHPHALPVLVTRSEDDFSIETVGSKRIPVLRIPAHFFCYLVGHSERVNAGG